MKSQSVTKILFLFITFSLLGISQASQAQKFVVSEFNYQSKDSVVELTYNLLGKENRVYKVNILLKKESDPKFIYQPKSLTGSVGKGKFTGNQRKIIWSYMNEFKQGLPDKDYYFEITVKRVKYTWAYVLGSSIIAGGVTGVLLTRGKANGSNNTESFETPVRP